MSWLRITGGSVVAPTGTRAADVVVHDGVIVQLADRPAAIATARDTIDADGAIVAPGFVDLQVNGAYGIDLTSEPRRVGELAALLPRHGVTAFVPTIVTSGAATRRAALDAIADIRRDGDAPGAARALGLHFEGPMLSPSRPGAHTARLIGAIDADELAGWHAEAGVALVTLAPELPDALAVIERLRARGVVVAAGHTDATPVEFAAGRRAGITYVTHLFNAMRPFMPRDPGTVGAALTDDTVVAGLICDGVHVDPVAVRLAWRVFGPDRLNLVTDAVAALGAPAGATRLGRVDVTVDDTGVRTADGVLAGSNLSLDTAVRNLVAFTGCHPHDALRTVTSTPAAVLGRADVGAVRVGAPADLVVLEPDLTVRATVVGGVVAWRS